ncbi:rhodanese-like domain-containing protein [Gramella sp. GC03-9]|uniref:Rhodanese-like domain-containing protein n=1 Tax=Christiangramia oceanisediminis TaxID=2920386 RepID=A0A9X2KV73_9FLAO|nr:rhodanese-like domain-containing protein [Gramella oceanisediminis]MCP9198897.1 rhodanese-like domain-containing protein [Gramella oceanisediminis]
MVLKKVIFGFIFIFIGFSANSQKTLDHLLDRYNRGDIPYISVEELKMKLEKEKLVLLDARKAEEFEVSHIRQASLFEESNESHSLSNVDKDTEIIVYCSLGIRSEKAARKLKKAGFRNVRNLYGGIFEWKNKGYEVVNDEGEQTEKVHVYSENWSQWLNQGEKIY